VKSKNIFNDPFGEATPEHILILEVRCSILPLDTAPILSMRIAAFGSTREISDESKTS
jgi:hypothetical protein